MAEKDDLLTLKLQVTLSWGRQDQKDIKLPRVDWKNSEVSFWWEEILMHHCLKIF